MNSSRLKLHQSRSKMLGFCREHLKKCGFDGKYYLLRDIIGKNIVNNRLPMGGNSSWLDKIR